MATRSSHVFFGVVLVFLLAWQVSAGATQLGLEDAVESALEESIDYRIVQLEWEQAQLAYKKAMADNLLTQSTYDHRLAELNLMKAETAYKKGVATAVTTAVRRFSDVELAMLDLRIREQQLQLSAKAEELTLKKAATQNASEYEVLEAKATLAKSQFDYQRAADDLAEKQQAFSILIGSEEHLPDGKLHFVPFDTPLPEILAQVLESSVAIREARDSLELAKLELEKLLLEETADLLVRDARNKVTLAELRFQQSQATITQDLLAAYNGVNNAQRVYEASNNALELQSRQHDITKGQVAAGLKTEDDLAKARIALWEAERSVYEALTNYVVAYLQFDEATGEDVRMSLETMVKGING